MKELIESAYARRLLKSGETVAVAVSGGADSMTLLTWFINNAAIFGVKFFVVNFEHGIRGKSSIDDSQFVKDFCAEHGLTFKGYSLDILNKTKGKTVEERARIERYKVFKALLESGECDKIATAHHAEDNVETVIMRILRGTGIRGLTGIPPERDGIIRPLLYTPHAEIEDYIKTENIKYVSDETNYDSRYRRNFLRNEVFPLISREVPSFERNVDRLIRNATQSEDYLNSVTPPPKIYGQTAEIEVGQPEYILKRQTADAFRALGVNADIEERHLNILANFACTKTGSRLNMPFGFSAYKERGKIVLERTLSASDESIPIKLPFDIVFDGKRIICKPYTGAKIKKGELVIDGNKLPPDTVLRHRQEGDIFKKFGGGTKNFGDYLTDIKIPLRLRDGLVVCASGKDILFVVGIEISDKLRAESLKNTKNLFIITTEE